MGKEVGIKKPPPYFRWRRLTTRTLRFAAFMQAGDLQTVQPKGKESQGPPADL